jgi:hypothetical protein
MNMNKNKKYKKVKIKNKIKIKIKINKFYLNKSNLLHKMRHMRKISRFKIIRLNQKLILKLTMKTFQNKKLFSLIFKLFNLLINKKKLKLFKI